MLRAVCEADSRGWVPIHILVDDMVSALIELTGLGYVLTDPYTGRVFPTRTGRETNADGGGIG